MSVPVIGAAQVGAPGRDDEAETTPPSLPSGWLRRMLGNRPVRWLAALLVVAALVTGTVTVFRHSVAAQQTNDPRSSTPFGAGALGTLLAEEGVAVRVADNVDDAVGQSDAGTTLVIANPGRLSGDQARRLAGSKRARLIVLQPAPAALVALGIAARSVPGDEQTTLQPTCDDSAAQLAGAISATSMPFSYRATGRAELACYPTEAGFAYLRVGGVDLVGGAITNTELGDEGNAAFALNVFGSQPRLVWLMAPTVAAGSGPAQPRPTLLPAWWAMGVVQACVALAALGIWRGRRLGPILVEALPVTVRAAETVEGHGRLYYRLGARDRAASALRAGSRQRLARAFGHGDDIVALTAAVATRTASDPNQIRALLAGPAPDTDDQLTRLARDLDQIELEARRP